MDHKTRGIILHTIKYSESSVIAKIYTEKFGLLSFLVKGVRASKSKNKASMMQPLTLLDMEISYRETRGLQYIKEYSRAYNYTSVPFDTLKSAIAMLLLEVITKSIHEHEPNDEMFEFIYESFVALDVDAHLNPDFHLLFLLSFARFLGFAPHNNYAEGNRYFEMQEGVFVISEFGHNVLGRRDSEMLSHLLNTPLYMHTDVKLTRADRQSLLRNLIKYYQLHLENFNLKSPDILETLLD
ncbi:MAG: DNA repair protein RecO [Bacteroidetes bacterium]|nr:DNA repair protein RecO [Bacteroidota bacterium]